MNDFYHKNIVTWSMPYHGVEHILGDRYRSSDKFAQITATKYNDNLVTLNFWKRDPIKGGMKPYGNEQVFSNLAEAKAAGEKWWLSLFN